MKKLNKIISFCLFCSFCFSACKSDHKPPPIEEKALVPEYNIYIENSGSMDGFVKSSGTPFQNTIYRFLSDINDNKLAKGMKLNFIINEKVAPYQFDIKRFIHIMTPNEFKKIRGEINTSEISIMLKKVLEKTNEKNVNIWISDCVFTPSNGNNPISYLGFEKTAIKSSFRELLNNGNYATVVIQLMSNFNGVYCNNKINHDRPYYIWIIAKEDYVKKIFEKIPLTTFYDSCVRNIYSFSNDTSSIKHLIIQAPNYQLSTRNPKNQILNANPIQAGPNSGQFQFCVGLNLKESVLGLDDKYVLDIDNYTVNSNSNSNYTLEINKNLSANGNYTHILRFTTRMLRPDVVKIKLNNNLPSWVTEINSTNAGALTSNDRFRTFGFKTLIEGVKEAYGNNPIFETNISISVN